MWVRKCSLVDGTQGLPLIYCIPKHQEGNRWDRMTAMCGSGTSEFKISKNDVWPARSEKIACIHRQPPALGRPRQGIRLEGKAAHVLEIEKTLFRMVRIVSKKGDGSYVQVAIAVKIAGHCLETTMHGEKIPLRKMIRPVVKKYIYPMVRL